MKKKVVGLGEVLWDHLPERTCLGGAPANFAYITTLMGDQGIVASRVGEDSLGLEALRRMEELGLNIDHVQTDRQLPTGTVKVEVDSKGLAHNLKLVCITRGGRGSLLVRSRDSSEHPGFRVRVADTVGSGDAFTAGLVHEYLQGASLGLMNEVANLVGAWVASEVGAMPAPKRGALEHSLAEIR
jgi:sugar/nucleoside kinase (ribokinase family)